MYSRTSSRCRSTDQCQWWMTMSTIQKKVTGVRESWRDTRGLHKEKPGTFLWNGFLSCSVGFCTESTRKKFSSITETVSANWFMWSYWSVWNHILTSRALNVTLVNLRSFDKSLGAFFWHFRVITQSVIRHRRNKMSYHLDMIKQAASTHIDDLYDILRNESGYEANKNPSLFSCITSLRKDHVRRGDESLSLTRVFILTEDSSSYAGVGWVVSSEVRCCMRCAATFGLFNPRHHCRACGDVICGLCVQHNVLVEDIKDIGPLKVCLNCYDSEKVSFLTSLSAGYL